MKIQLGKDVFEMAVIASKKEGRSIEEQINLWVRLGMIVESMLTENEAESLLKGDARIRCLEAKYKGEVYE